jgi:glyoxylate carboligase
VHSHLHRAQRLVHDELKYGQYHHRHQAHRKYAIQRQEVDAVGITRSCVKHNFLVKDTNDLATIVKKAFHIATTGRPGPVLRNERGKKVRL